jgi:hypothetical protein
MAESRAAQEFAETMKKNRMERTVPLVVNGVEIGRVSNKFTSIGAAKKMGCKAAKMENIQGVGYSWIPAE